MCFQISQSQAIKKLNKKYGSKSSPKVKILNQLEPNYHLNGFTHPNAFIISKPKSNAVLNYGRWGIAPESTTNLDLYYKQAQSFGGGLNAKSEVLFNHFLYKNVIHTQRCIIPVSGFIEPYRFNGKSFPYFIKAKTDNTLSLAGIFTTTNQNHTFSIITKKASPFFEKVHNVKKRQPVILNSKMTDIWLDPNSDISQITNCINSKFNEDSLEYYTISNSVYKKGINTNIPETLSPFFYQELQTLF